MKKILSYILCFFAVQIIALFLILQFIVTPFLEKESLLKIIANSGFYIEFSNEVQSSFQNYIYQSGLSEDVIEGLYTEQMAKEDAQNLINYAFGGEEDKNFSEFLKGDLENRIDSFLVQENLKKNSQMETNIKKFEDIIFSEYNDICSDAKTACNFIRNNLVFIQKVVLTARCVCVTLILIFLVLLRVFGKNYIWQSIETVGITLGGIFIAICLFLNRNLKLDDFLLYNQSISNLVRFVFSFILNTIKNISICSFSAGVLGFLLTISKKEEEQKLEK